MSEPTDWYDGAGVLHKAPDASDKLYTHSVTADYWTTVLMSRHSNQLSMEEVRTLAFEIAAAIASAEEATVLACAEIADDHAEELIDMIGKDLGPNYGQVDKEMRDRRVKDQAYTARIIGQRIRALLKTPGILATYVSDQIQELCKRGLYIPASDYEVEINSLKRSDAEIRRQERERLSPHLEWALSQIAEWSYDYVGNICCPTCGGILNGATKEFEHNSVCRYAAFQSFVRGEFK